jgi:hypothetical protein
MKSNSLVQETSDDALSPYVVAVTIEDEIAAEKGVVTHHSEERTATRPR